MIEIKAFWKTGRRLKASQLCFPFGMWENPLSYTPSKVFFNIGIYELEKVKKGLAFYKETLKDDVSKLSNK